MGHAADNAPIVGYCTNVHAGPSLDQVQAGLDQYATAVRERVTPGGELPIGLWLPADAADALRDADAVTRFRDWLRERRLRVYTVNGFPYGHFHRDRVKHDVYRPDWTDPRRVEYTLRLARILAALHEPGAEAGISTLPIGWAGYLDRSDVQHAAAHLTAVADELARLEAQTGVCVHLDLEPEPGCVLDTSEDVAHFFNQFLFPRTTDPQRAQRYLRVCHDICHAAVMFEDQHDVLALYRAAGVRVGKVQVSSALAAECGRADDPATRTTLDALARFAEDRYLHQTVIDRSRETLFFEDLPAALRQRRADPAGTWRVHYHVPVFLTEVDGLSTTQAEIARCFEAIEPADGISAFEVETYTWSVLPAPLRSTDLAEGIARELRCVTEQLSAHMATT